MMLTNVLLFYFGFSFTFMIISQFSRPTVVTFGSRGNVYVPSWLHRNPFFKDVIQISCCSNRIVDALIDCCHKTISQVKVIGIFQRNNEAL
jgi:hypothetical protein